MQAPAKTSYELDLEYLERFGSCISIPFGVVDFTEQDFNDEATWALENGIPFDQNSPRWRWSTEPLPDGVII